jgi:hypothetical protein
MEKRKKEVLVIYRLKFKSEHDFQNAVQTFGFGQNMAKYLESLQGSFGLQRPQPNYPGVTPPRKGHQIEIFSLKESHRGCHDFRIIMNCS